MDAKICRTCLTNTGSISLFIKQDDNMPLYEKIMKYSNINISEEDGFPDQICSTCESELAITHDYIVKCIASDTKLRERISLESYELDQPIKEEILSDSVFEADCFDTNVIEENEVQANEVKVNKKKVKWVFGKKKRTKKKKVPNKRFECLKCGLKVNSLSTLKIHELIHSGVKPYECNYCDRRFTREDNRTKHLLQHTRGRKKIVRNPDLPKYQPEQCSLCGLLIKSPSAMVIHMRSHTGEKPFSCEHCEKSFRTKGSLHTHHETNHLDQGLRTRKFICEACGKKFYRKREIGIHMMTHTGEKPHACPFCSKRFLQIASLIRHKSTHTGDKPFNCNVCNRAFSSSSSLNVHMHVHSNKRDHQCHLCEKLFKTNNSLRAHLLRHKNTKHYICNDCGLACTTKGNLIIHIKRLHSERSGECIVCLKMVSNIEIHMKRHTGEMSEVCEICNRTFSNKISLKHHLSFKHEAGKYKCTIKDCEKSFPLPTMLEFHLLKFHKNHRPHVCKHCSRGFYRVSDLSNHYRLYHSEMEPPKVKLPKAEKPPKLKE